MINAREAIPEELGKPSALIADAGYSNAEAFEQLEELGCKVYVSVSSENDHNRRGYEFRPPGKLKPPKQLSNRIRPANDPLVL